MPAAAAPDGAAQDGGSLIDTVTVPEAGFCIDIVPPPQLITIKATAMTREASKSETGRRFSQSWTWASMGASDLSKMKLYWQMARCGTERNRQGNPRCGNEKRVLRLLRVSARCVHLGKHPHPML